MISQTCQDSDLLALESNEKLMSIYFSLATAKNSGRFLLINKLLSNPKNHGIVKKLLNGKEYPTITVHPSSDDNLLDFVAKIFEKAQNFASNKQHSLQKAAQQLVENVRAIQTGQLHSLETVEESWNAFCAQLFLENT